MATCKMNYDEILEIRVVNKDGTTIVYKDKGLEKFKKLCTPPVAHAQPQQAVSTPKSSSKYAPSVVNIKPMSGGDVFSNAEALKIQSGLNFSK